MNNLEVYLWLLTIILIPCAFHVKRHLKTVRYKKELELMEVSPLVSRIVALLAVDLIPISQSAEEYTRHATVVEATDSNRAISYSLFSGGDTILRYGDEELILNDKESALLRKEHELAYQRQKKASLSKAKQECLEVLIKKFS